MQVTIFNSCNNDKIAATLMRNPIFLKILIVSDRGLNLAKRVCSYNPTFPGEGILPPVGLPYLLLRYQAEG